MWKKIHSNRDPRDTLCSELRKEFGSYFDRGGMLTKQVMARYPRVFFYGMVLSLFISAVFSFTLFRQKEKKPLKMTAQPVNTLQVGFNQLLETTGRIRATLYLKHQVDSLSAKKHLTRADSIALDNALTRLDHLHPR